MNRNSDSLIGNGGGRNNLHTNGFHHHNIQKSVLDDDDDDDLLSSSNQEEDGKHDYDWLLTPPGTPLLPSSDGKASQPTSVAPRRNSSVRSGSTVKTSRLSVSQSESSHSSRPARSSSAARPSISTTQYTNRNSNILNTSSTSVSSYIKPSAISNRSSSAARPTSRATTPSRTRPSSTTTSINRTIKPSQNSRPSTPTRRTPTPSLLPSSPSGGRAALPSNGRISRPSSPVSHVRPPPQPPIIILHDFQHKRPPNLSTTLPERPLSAGRSRPGAAMTVKGHVQNTNSGTITKRPSSPIVNRGRGRPHTNGNVVEMLEPRKTSHLPIKMSNTENGMGFGRSISKKSLDMAIKHMDIRNGGIRPLSSSTLFPQSIRTGNSKMQRGRAPSGSVRNEVVAPQHNRASYSSKVAEMDMYESSRYDAMLLKEDLNNTSWLHSISTDDENSDQGPVFDNGFEPPPEPFGPL